MEMKMIKINKIITMLQLIYNNSLISINIILQYYYYYFILSCCLFFVFIVISKITMSSQVAVRVGDYVRVDSERRVGRPDSEGGNGYIVCTSPSIDVRYVVSGLLSPDVDSCRVHQATIGTTGRRRRGNAGPSILTPTYSRYVAQQRLIVEGSTSSTASIIPVRRRNIFENCRVNTRYLLSIAIEKKGKGMIETIVRMNSTNEEGWLRRSENLQDEASKTRTQGTYLNVKEKEMVVKLTTCMKMLCQRAVSYVAYAWGVSRWTVQRILRSEMLGISFEKKKFKNMGLTLFNCEKKDNQP